MRKWLLAGLLAVAGCQGTLETGYKPTPLDASDSQRRALYAPAYSPERRAAQEDPSKGTDFRHNSQSY